MFSFFGGVPQIVKPDNLKASVTKACYYEPDLNPTYHEMAVHYGAAVIPTRVRKPKDKALGENAVQQVERWVLAALRNQRFFSLHELNQAIRERLRWLNDRKRSDTSLSRQEMFEALEKVALRPLPERPFEYIEVKQAKVHIDYHVTYQQYHYSAPHQFCRQTRRLTRLTNAFSKKFENLEAAVALWFAYYNFVRPHRTLNTTPAVRAGVEKWRWNISQLLEYSLAKS
jgi:transposase InsO family protein